jgi:hypothetical protein
LYRTKRLLVKVGLKSLFFLVYSNVKDGEEFSLSGPFGSPLEIQEKVATILKR